MSEEPLLPKEEHIDDGPYDPTDVFPSPKTDMLDRIFDQTNKRDHRLAALAIKGLQNHDTEALIRYLIESPRLVMDRKLREQIVVLLQGDLSTETKGRSKEGKLQGVQLRFVKPERAARKTTPQIEKNKEQRKRLTALFAFLEAKEAGRANWKDAIESAAQAVEMSPKSMKGILSRKYLDALSRCVWARTDGYKEDSIYVLPSMEDRETSYFDADVDDSRGVGFRWRDNSLLKYRGSQAGVQLARVKK